MEKDKEIEKIITQKNKEKEEEFIIIKNNIKKNNNLYDDDLYGFISEIEEKLIIEEQIQEKLITLILNSNVIECRKFVIFSSS